MFNRLAAIAFAGVFAFSSVAFSADDKKDDIDKFFDQIPGSFSADVTLASDYAFRGVSQTGANPAIQGTFGYSVGFDAGIPINLYGSAWGSNVNFGPGDPSYLEIDLTIGINTELKGVSMDFYTIWYTYPDTSGTGNDYVEYAFGLGYDFGFASLGTAFVYSPDYTVNAGEFYYFSADISVPLPFKFTLDTHVGTGAFERNAGVDFTDWSVALSRDIRGFTLQAAYVDNDLNDTRDCGGLDNCDARGVFSVSKSF
jgi:uncharacterized protein (TIGR02001 family)